jgi:hypothetical protein
MEMVNTFAWKCIRTSFHATLSVNWSPSSQSSVSIQRFWITMFISYVFVVGLAALTLAVPHNKRAVAFFNPNLNGGSMLDDGV